MTWTKENVIPLYTNTWHPKRAIKKKLERERLLVEDEAENGGGGEREEMQPTLCGGHFLAGLSFLNLWTTVAPSGHDW